MCFVCLRYEWGYKKVGLERNRKRYKDDEENRERERKGEVRAV